MFSSRILELVNCLHHKLTETECGEYYPFGGKQIVLVGKFPKPLTGSRKV